MRVSEQSLFIFKVHCQKKSGNRLRRQENHNKIIRKKQQQKKKEGFIEWAAQNGKKIIKQTLAFVSNFFFLFFFCNKCNFLLFSSFSLSLLPSLGFRIFSPIPLICFVCLSYLFGIFFSSLSPSLSPVTLFHMFRH